MKKSFVCVLTVLMLVLLPCGIFGAAGGGEDGLWVIKFKAEPSLSSAAAVGEMQENEELAPLGQEDSLYYTTTDPAVAAEFAASGLCEYVEETGISYATTAPNDPLYAKTSESASVTDYQYALALLNAEGAWSKTLGSSGINVVVIDSGFDYSHEDGTNIHAGYDYIADKTNTEDSGGHGTACAGIIGATYNNGLGIAGAAPNCNITMLRCFSKKSSGETVANNADIAAAIRDAVDVYDADVISMSFGSSGNDTVLREAVDYAYNKGAIMVAATGNYGYKGSPLEYPAAYSKVIGVGAVDSNGDVAYYSTQNQSTYVVAPGSYVLSLSPGGNKYAYDSGTSFATPYVASLAALAKSLDSNLASSEFRSLLRSTVKDLGSVGYDYSYGYGLVDYTAFVTKMVDRSFLDVPDNEWYTEAVYHLKNTGVISGRTLYTYCPNESVTRGEFVALLARLSQDNLSGFSYKGPFADVASSSWYNSMINWAYSKQIVLGVSTTAFAPESEITREEMATMLCRYMEKSGIAITDKGAAFGFSDVSAISFWARGQVEALVKAELLKGFEDNTFRPAANTTRAEAAVLLERVNKL